MKNKRDYGVEQKCDYCNFCNVTKKSLRVSIIRPIEHNLLRNDIWKTQRTRCPSFRNVYHRPLKKCRLFIRYKLTLTLDYSNKSLEKRAGIFKSLYNTYLYKRASGQ